MFPNVALSALTALFPLLLGFVWYHPKIFGTAWMKANDVAAGAVSAKKMMLIFLLTYILSFFISLSLHAITIHQFGLQSLLVPEMGHPLSQQTIAVGKQAMIDLKGSFRTFRHGAYHGASAGIFLITPIICIGALFEKKGWKYILINAGFWIINLAVMGGIICRYA